MGLATHLGPWLLGTQKTTGVVAGNNVYRNLGATTVGQTATVTYSDAATTTAFYIPAGSVITNIAFYTAGITGTSPTLTVYAGATALTTTQSLTSATAYAASLTFATGAAATLANVGTSDVAIKYTVGGSSLSAGTGTLVVQYIVRNSDGSTAPSASQA